MLAALHVSAFASGISVVDPHAHYPEGPLWRDGKLFFVEYATDDVKVWNGGDLRIYWHAKHCGPIGLFAWHGGMIVACYDDNSLVELNAAGRSVRVIRKDSAGKPFFGPNDFTGDGRGGLYFSASGDYDIHAPISGSVLHMTANGQSIQVLASTIDYSNGLTLSKSGRHLLVAEMFAGRILSFPIEANGDLGPRTVWARLQDLAPPTPHEDAYNGPDGLKLGPDGNYYIAQNGSGRILVVDRHRRLVRTIIVPTPYVSNIAFGPNGADTLFITGVFDQWKPPFPGIVYRWTR